MSDAGIAPPGQTVFQSHLGIRYFKPPPDAAPGTVVIESEVRDDLRGPAGSLEGGVVATLIDVAGASSAATALQSLVATQAIAIQDRKSTRLNSSHFHYTTLFRSCSSRTSAFAISNRRPTPHPARSSLSPKYVTICVDLPVRSRAVSLRR